MLEVVCISNMPYLTGDGFITDQPLINLTLGKRYSAERSDADQRGWLRVWDDFGEDYLYPPHMFEVQSEA